MASVDNKPCPTCNLMFNCECECSTTEDLQEELCYVKQSAQSIVCQEWIKTAEAGIAAGVCLCGLQAWDDKQRINALFLGAADDQLIGLKQTSIDDIIDHLKIENTAANRHFIELHQTNAAHITESL